MLGVYGDPLVKTPNIDRLAKTIDKNALKKAISEVSDPKLKEEFQNRLKNADSKKSNNIGRQRGDEFYRIYLPRVSTLASPIGTALIKYI